LIDEFVPEEVDREEPHGDSQDLISQSVGQADSGSKIYGSTKVVSVESGEKVGHDTNHGSNMHPSLSGNVGMRASLDPSNDDVTQAGKILNNGDALMGLNYDPRNGLGTCLQEFLLDITSVLHILHHFQCFHHVVIPVDIYIC
jgi:hypothetical protein